MAYIFLAIIVIFSGYVLWICRKKNAWDILFYNSMIGILVLLTIGLLVNDKDVWLKIISFIGVVATGSAITSSFLKIPQKNETENK